ncbi:MAG: hypothetical protein JWO47_270 [Candidatus Saccharibacteria bacterium]|nr:hypothetical protein [Candidatus Saccharibacteria bacterium]
MRNTIESVGFVGFGPMGQLMGRHMFPGAEIEFVDPNVNQPPDGISATKVEDNFTFSRGSNQAPDAVVLTVPARAFWPVSKEVILGPIIEENWPEGLLDELPAPLIVDPCSVKMFTEAVIARRDPNYPELLHCHPLFGPQSATKSVAGKTVIVTKKVGEKADKLLGTWEELGLKIVEMTAEEHDEKMAYIQLVPFLLGRIANKLGLRDLLGSGLETPTFMEAIDLANLDEAHSDELFRTIMDFNPFAHRILFRIRQQINWIEQDSLPNELLLHQLGLLQKEDLTS